MAVKEGQLFISGEITSEPILGKETTTLTDIKHQLQGCANCSSLCIHIQSPGGSVYDGYKMFHTIKQFTLNADGTKKPTRCVIEGEAQSMATFIACIADKGKVEIANPSRYMIHNPQSGVKGDSTALKGGAQELEMIEQEMAQVYADRTGLPVDQIKTMMKNTTNMTAEEAVRLGFADHLSQHLRAVALGKPMKKQNKQDSLLKKIGTAIVKMATMEGPAALDLTLQDGTILSSDADSEDTINGSNVMLNGVVAPDGDYTTVDGMVLTVVGGIVTNVVDPADASALEQQIADLQTKLTQAKTKKPLPTPAPAPAKTPAPVPMPTQQAAPAPEVADQAIVQALGEVEALKKQVEELRKKPVGDQNKPDNGMNPERKPFAIGYGNTPQAAAVELSKQFIAQHMPHLEMSYKKRGMDYSWFKEYQNSGPVMTSILETNFNFTYPGILTEDLLYKPSIDTPAIADMFTIDTNIKFQKQYNLVAVLNQILKPYFGCGPTAGNSNGSRDRISNTTLVTKEFRMEESWCKDDFTTQLSGTYQNLAQAWLKTGEKSFDPAGTPIDSIITTTLQDALRRDVFGRLTMAAGNSSSVNFNQIDGLWDRLIDSSGAQINYCVVRAGSALGIGTPTAANAIAALEACYIQAPTILKQTMNKATFWVTGSIYDAYINQLIGQGNVSVSQFENTITGVQGNKTWDGGVTYKGIPVKPVRYWDSSLTDANNPLFATTRNLVLLTIKENHVAGIESTSDLNNINSWYENKDSKRYYRADMKFGYQYMHCDLQIIAF